MYKSAIENAQKIKNEYYTNMAIINFTRELFLLKDPEFAFYKNLFNNINSPERDIQWLKIDVETLIKSQPNVTSV